MAYHVCGTLGGCEWESGPPPGQNLWERHPPETLPRHPGVPGHGGHIPNMAPYLGEKQPSHVYKAFPMLPSTLSHSLPQQGPVLVRMGHGTYQWRPPLMVESCCTRLLPIPGLSLAHWGLDSLGMIITLVWLVTDPYWEWRLLS